MASLEQAALSGALTTVNLGGIADPDGLEPHRDPSSDDDEAADVMPDLDDDQSYMVNADTTASIMSRGWSGNTGPKGVLLDFKASHGKSGAILGGSDDRGGTNSRKQGSHKKNQIGSNSETDSESDKDTRHAVTTSSLYNGGRRTTHRIADRRGGGFSIGGHARKSSGSPPSVSPIINAANIKTDSRGKKLFGHLREVGVDNFIQAVESERDDKDTVVLVHLYDPALDSCTILNSHLSSLARLYPRTKFLRALAAELDFFNSSPSSTGTHSREFSFPLLSPSVSPRASYELANDLLDGADPDEGRSRRPTDSDVLPTLLWYRGGEYVQSLPALERELPNGMIKRGEAGCRELCSLLSRFGILSDGH